MFNLRIQPVFGVLVLLIAGLPSIAQDASVPATPPDSTLFTTYTVFGSAGAYSVDWIVCGSTQQSSGCYGSGSIGPFVAVGAMLEGLPSVAGEVVTRYIYVVDSGSSGVVLYVYKKVDTISASYDDVTVTLSNTVNLPLTGGSTAVASMAANTGYLFIGTNLSPQAVQLRKSTLRPVKIGGFSPPINVSAITADEYGYVTITQGDATGESGFYTYGPTGSLQEDGGGSDFMLGTQQAVTPNASLTGASAPPHHLGYQMKTPGKSN
jgi:hypothetical protein